MSNISREEYRKILQKSNDKWKHYFAGGLLQWWEREPPLFDPSLVEEQGSPNESGYVLTPVIDSASYCLFIECCLHKYQITHGAGEYKNRDDKWAFSRSRYDMPGVYVTLGDALIGGLTFEVDNDWVFLRCGFVAPPFRKMGIYTALVRKVERYARESGHCGVWLCTHDFEAPALYEKLGYTLGTLLPNCPKGNTTYDYYKVFGGDEG